MTYELFEKAKELYDNIEHYNSLLDWLTTKAISNDKCHQVALLRVNDPNSSIHFGADPICFSKELACVIYDAIYAEKEKLEKEFAKLEKDT